MFHPSLFFLLLVVLSFHSPLAAADERAPRIVCRDARGNSFQLDLKDYFVEVERHLDLVETTLTLTFNNDTYTRLEGELLLPLPPQATISGYALEINGEFREAVAVEQKRARLAYETIKARRVDPGIVEKEADGLYRTRIYPIMPRSTKGVRISYLEYLPITGPNPFRPTYRLPFNLTSKVDNISVLVRNPGEDIISHSSLEFLKNSEGDLEAILQGSTLDGTLTIEATDPHRPTAVIADGQRGLAYLTLNQYVDRNWGAASAPLKQAFHPAPKKVALFWDASRSMAGTDWSTVTEYLNAFFKAHPNLTVSLSFLRNIREEAGEFQVREGNWKTLREAIEKASYDGSSNFTNLSTEGCDLTLLVTDGQATQWGVNFETRTPKTPLVALATREVLPLSPLGGLTFRSGGRVLNLASLDSLRAVELTLQPPFQLPFPTPGIEVIPLPSLPPFVHRFLLREENGSEVNLKIALRRLNLRTEKMPPRWIEHLFGITRLQQLESSGASPSELIAHCEKHTLASDLTSLIVLENFEDHIEFEIPPPEADLRAKYEAAMKRKHQQVDERLTWVWAEVLKRHRMKAPGIEVLIYNELSRIQKHNQAQGYAFEPEQLDEPTREAFLSWEERAKELLKRREEAKDDTKKEAWKKELLRLRNDAQELTFRKPQSRTPLAVSIRGFVRNPGTKEFEKAMTLKEALTEVGPLDPRNLSFVSFYRSGDKTIYNVLSKDFRDFALLPGDMIVVHDRVGVMLSDDDPFASSDPFSDGGGGGGSDDFTAEFADEPAVIELPQEQNEASQIPESFLTRDLGLNTSGVEEDNTRRDIEFDPVPIAVRAMELHREGKVAAGRLHLSNLRELFPRQGSALRLEALVLWKIGAAEEAKKVLREALKRNETDYLAANLLATMTMEDGQQQAVAIYEELLDSSWGQDEFLALTILLTDRNALLKRGPAEVRESKLPKDLRVVVTNLHPDPSFQLAVVDPTSFSTRKGEVSTTGVMVISTLGLYEITDKETIEGDYVLQAHCERDQLLLVSTYEKFSSSQQTATHEVFVLKAGKEPKVVKTISCK